MKFSCYKDELTDALQFVTRAVAVKAMTPILAGIYMKAEGSTLELQATNFSTGIIARIPATTEIPGETVVSGKRFQEFIRNMPDDNITFIEDDSKTKLQISSGGAGVELLTMVASDFPRVKAPDTDNSFKIRTITLRDLIRKTVFAVAKEETRPVFSGCAFEIHGDKISVVATNTHRLALASDKLTETYGDSNFVVPAETLRSLMSRLDPKEVDNYITVNYSARYLTFSFDNVFMTSRLIEGQFPPYDRVIPNDGTTKVNVSTSDFKNAVEFVALMSKETEYNTTKFKFADNTIDITSNSPDIGDAGKSVEAQTEGEELEIAFNAEYIADVLRVIDAPRINIRLNDKFSPAAFTVPDDENYIYVVTPVRA
ncbi:MAG: DNA polymerase III subunit beta [Selenomonadaceae bacterium]|nr:DNA polymerase III subunit beta [Selenomonadaceae bacterium]